jgi:hypothetical protein
MNNRIYNKLYVNKNREEGSEKLLLGYQTDLKEIVLKKDTETYFHIPPYTDSVLLTDSNLIANGATGGSFPAVSDRIFKSKKNYGETTAHGNPSDSANGTWYCSWLYKNELGQLQWMDRWFNPGYFDTASPDLMYVVNNPIFRDVPSSLKFEPGVLYKYFHIGEETAKQTLSVFFKDSVVLDLQNWGTEQVDVSKNSVKPKIYLGGNFGDLYSTNTDSDRVPMPVVNLDQKAAVEISLDYDSRYNPINEFTLSMWSKSPNWNTAPTTQMIGNYSSSGGYGIFIQNLESFPFFAIPETKYGHVLFVNEALNGYLDKSVQEIPKVPATAAFTTIDFNQNVIVCIQDNSGTIYKLDNSGQIIANSKTAPIPFNFIYFDEIPIQVLIGFNNTIIIRTQKMIYTLDEKFNKINQLRVNTTENDVTSYSYDIANDSYELNITYNAFDSKFIETTQWMISADGNLYKKEANADIELFYIFPDKASNLAIDPSNRIWVLHGTNKLTILDSAAVALDTPLVATNIGRDTTHNSKNLNFVSTYNRKNKVREWKAIIYYSNEEYVYALNLNGQSTNTINIYSLFDSNLVTALEQNIEQFQFFGKGDFTGYEHRRVFKQLSPYNNKSQIVLKTSLRDSSKPVTTFEQFVSKTSIDNWTENSWQHLALRYNRQEFELFLNGKQILTQTHSGKYLLSYDLNPTYYIGTSGGSKSGFNREVQNISETFIGLIGNVKIYNFAMPTTMFEVMLREVNLASDITWTLPVPFLQYIEKIERMFKHKIPGSKSSFYRIRLRGTEIEDTETRNIITNQIKNLAEDMQPGYADFFEIQWID